MYQAVWSASSCCLSFGPPVSVICPVYRNGNEEECLPLVSASKGCASLIQSSERRLHESKPQRIVPIMTENFPATDRNESNQRENLCTLHSRYLTQLQNQVEVRSVSA